MSITTRQFNLLQAMGINVWQRRNLSVQTSEDGALTHEHISATNQLNTQETISVPVPTQLYSTDFISVDLETLRNEPLFNDIIMCLGININDLTVENNHIDLGVINWQFHQHNQIEFTHSRLITPELSSISRSPQLKKQLWQYIQSLST